MPEFLQKMKIPTRYRGVVVFSTLFIAAILLIAVNYLTIQIKSSIRAFIQAESHYSRGQKDAATYLMLYLSDQEDEYYDLFLQHLSVPLGDGRAINALIERQSQDLIYEGFIQGRNHPDDIEKMIWLHKRFRNVTFIKEAFEHWKRANVLIDEMQILGDQIHSDVQSGALFPSDIRKHTDHISDLSNRLTQKETAFSESLGAAARGITNWLTGINTAIIVIIMGMTALIIRATFGALQESRIELKKINDGLMRSNQQLDSFIYASSHDLKSPLNNLEGLLKIFMIRSPIEDPEQIAVLGKMQESIDRLKETIANIEDLIRVDRLSQDDVAVVHFEELLNQIINENEMSFITDHSEISTTFEVQKIRYSKLALKSILYNLVSNAIKYQSPHRKLQLRLSTYKKNNHTYLEVSDNGLGIDLEKHGDKIFSMFKRFHQHNTGSGLGLYAVKQVVEKEGGTISVESKVDEGTTFTIKF